MRRIVAYSPLFSYMLASRELVTYPWMNGINSLRRGWPSYEHNIISSKTNQVGSQRERYLGGDWERGRQLIRDRNADRLKNLKRKERRSDRNTSRKRFKEGMFLPKPKGWRRLLPLWCMPKRRGCLSTRPPPMSNYSNDPNDNPIHLTDVPPSLRFIYKGRAGEIHLPSDRMVCPSQWVVGGN